LQKKRYKFVKKTVPKSFRKKSFPFYKHYRFVSDPFEIINVDLNVGRHIECPPAGMMSPRLRAGHSIFNMFPSISGNINFDHEIMEIDHHSSNPGQNPARLGEVETPEPQSSTGK
jgi:hypothetical protein